MCLTCVNPTTSDPAYQANLAAAAGALATAGIDPASLSTVYGGIQFAGENGQPSNAYDTDFSNVAPRIGFAYQINPKTVIRGSYGLMYSIGLETEPSQARPRQRAMQLLSTEISPQATISVHRFPMGHSSLSVQLADY